MKSLVSSKSSTLLSELEFYDYHEGRPFTSHVITKRIVEIKETKTTFGSKLTNDSMENSKSKLQFTGKAIQDLDSRSYQARFRSHWVGFRSTVTFDYDSRKSKINSHAFIDDNFVKPSHDLSQKVSL